MSDRGCFVSFAMVCKCASLQPPLNGSANCVGWLPMLAHRTEERAHILFVMKAVWEDGKICFDTPSPLFPSSSRNGDPAR